jgi:hypothetical protein
VHMLGTGLTGGGDRSDRCELKSLQLLCFQEVCMHLSRGSCIGSGGACMCAGGALCGLSSFVSVVCALCLSFLFWCVFKRFRRIDERYGLRSKNIHPRAQGKGSDEF